MSDLRITNNQDDWMSYASKLEVKIEKLRNEIIEECALVADGFGYNMDIAKMLAAAIRALKDKEP